jgi:hypothetical protein
VVDGLDTELMQIVGDSNSSNAASASLSDANVV